jgi:hypothetical protein
MRKPALVILSLALLALVACQPAGRTEPKPQDFRSGTQGLVLEFVPNVPPFRIYDTEQAFNAQLVVHNRGAFEVGGPGDRVYLAGFDPNVITGIPTTGVQIPRIEGKSAFNSQGGQDVVTFQGGIRVITADKLPLPLQATACYSYETQASANVCVDPNPFAPTVRQRACVPANAGTGSQGAPIAVTNVELEARPQKTLFKVNVANVGGGDVFRYGGEYLVKCSPFLPPESSLRFDEIDHVDVVDVQVSGRSILQTCKPLDRGTLRLTGGSGSFFCELGNIPAGPAYVTPLTVTLRYGYRNVISKQAELVRAS